jgi:hypothetical protein
VVPDPVAAPHLGNHTIFLSGPPGAGKTTLAVRRLRHLLECGVPAEQILILLPQRTLAHPYLRFLQSAEAPAGGTVDVATIGGLARRTLHLFWPLVAEGAGFLHPDSPPIFLTLETAQYHMDRILDLFLSAGAFDGITIPRSRLVSQIIDNLNKSAAVGFSVDEIGARLKQAWSGESARERIYDQVQAAVLAFRRACLANNLLDWSLQIQVFWHHLLPLPQMRRYLLSGYRHLIVDNVEEDIPVTHDLLHRWLPLCESALLVVDHDGGYRVFLGADPQGAWALADLCHERMELSVSHVMAPDVEELGRKLVAFLHPNQPAASQPPDERPDKSGQLTSIDRCATPALALPAESIRFHPQMLDWVVTEVSRLVLAENLPQGEIAILAPFVSDALRFSLAERLASFGIRVRTHRPSRELREEPAVRCLLTLARLAHPGWRQPPPPVDVAHAFSLAIADLDPVRARLLTDIVYRVKDDRPLLTPFHQIIPETQQRISYLLGRRYGELWNWLQAYSHQSSAGDRLARLDHFVGRLFGEVLSQAGFGFHGDFDSGAAAANLMESIQKFHLGLPTDQEPSDPPPPDLSLEYLHLVERGVVAAQYVSSWQALPQDAVLLVPAYTFLMLNQPVTVQFWLDAGSTAWFERIYQPLTHPYVLRRDWPRGQQWTDEHEVAARQAALARLVLGLTRRCRRTIYLAYCELNERGYEQQGPLLQGLQRLLRAQRRTVS